MDLRPMLAQLYGATDDPDSLLTRLVNNTAETLASAQVSVSWGDRLLTLDFEAPDLSDFSTSTSTLRERKLPYSNDCSTVLAAGGVVVLDDYGWEMFRK